MRRLAFDEIRVIITFAYVKDHQAIIDACHFTDDEAKYYGAISDAAFKSGECFDISPRHAQQIVNRYFGCRLPEKYTDPIIRMFMSKRGCVTLSRHHCREDLAIRNYINTHFKPLLKPDKITPEIFRMVYNTDYVDATMIHMYLPTQYQIMHDLDIKVQTYISKAKPSNDWVMYLLRVTIEKDWFLGYTNILEEYPVLDDEATVSTLKVYFCKYLRLSANMSFEMKCQILDKIGMYHYMIIPKRLCDKYSDEELMRLIPIIAKRSREGLVTPIEDYDALIHC